MSFSTALKQSGKKIPYLSASAIGYYGNSGDALMHEEMPPTDQSFMVECCEAWEQAAQQMHEIGCPVTIFRIGVVLEKTRWRLSRDIETHALWASQAILATARCGCLGIHYQDLCNLFLWALENQITGVMNAVSPEVVRNKDFTKAVRNQLPSKRYIDARASLWPPPCPRRDVGK